MQQYQKLVTDLEYMIRDTIVTPEVAWRTNILVQSVEETDLGIQDQLMQYEQSIAQQERMLLYNNNNNHQQRTYSTDKKRVTQQRAACTKLRRDFNRCHNSMMSNLQTYQMRQRAEVSQLGAVQWNVTNSNGKNVVMGPLSMSQQPNTQMEEDFFERTMRQKELERMNQSMRKVHDIYHDLAGLVNGQQEQIDQMEGDVHDAQDHVQSGSDQYQCYMTRQNGWNAMCGDMNEWGQTENHHEYTTGSTKHVPNPDYSSTSQKLRIHETFYWTMPLETMAEDWKSVQNDFIGIGNNFYMHCCQRLDCCNDE
jgi:t-SNARE complex subunit (syntaxin)